MKKILIGLLALLVLVVGGVALYTNQLVGSAIERGATYALGVETRVGFVRLRLLRGDFALHGFRIANAEGFDEPSFLELDSAHIAVDLDTVRTQVVRIPDFTLDGIALALEREGKATNYGVILGNLKRFEKQGAGAPPDPERRDPEKRYIVDRVLIRDVDARIEWNEVASDATGVRVHIPQIELREIGADNAQGVVMSELTNIILKAILGAVARDGTNLPGAVLSGLSSGLGELGRVPGVVVTGAGKAAVDHVADVVGGRVGKALGGLFGGKKEDGR